MGGQIKKKMTLFTINNLTSWKGLMTDAALVYSALVYAALRKSGLISNGCSDHIADDVQNI
jgi:hypothetical protein